MSAYFYLAKMKILESLAYRFEVFTSIITNFVIMIASVYLWRAAYTGIGPVEGIEQSQMITYAIISSLLGTLFAFNVENLLNSRIREGDVAVDFIKPVNTFALYFAQDIGGTISALVQKFLPLLLFAIIFVKVPVPRSMTHFLLFLVSSAAGYLILWLLSAVVGITSFWIIELGPLGFVKDVIVRIMSGSIIPIWFFPEGMREVFNFFPFVYTYQVPVGLYIGKITPDEAGKYILLQIVWILLLFLLFYVMQKRARKHMLVQGG